MIRAVAEAGDARHPGQGPFPPDVASGALAWISSLGRFDAASGLQAAKVHPCQASRQTLGVSMPPAAPGGQGRRA
jgi:hypothetical protein